MFREEAEDSAAIKPIYPMSSTNMDSKSLCLLPFLLSRLAPRILDHTLPDTLPIRLPTPVSRLESIHCQIAQEWPD